MTPAPRGSRTGNRVTALRWAGLLRQLGHRVRIEPGWRSHACDVLVAVHAVKSAAAVLAAARERDDLPIVLLLSGTDVYPTFAPGEGSRAALQRADALVALQPLVVDLLPAELRGKARAITQSATAVDAPKGPRFRAALLAHLREVKQPLVAIEAFAKLPNELDAELLLAGGVLDDDYARRVERALAATPNARWLGELSRRDGKSLLASSHVCVVPSSSEGGANVVSEAIAAGTPVLCTAIPGNLGLLGDDWPATFAVGDADGLAALAHRAATDAAFYEQLRDRTRALQPGVAPAREREAWRALLAELTGG